MRKWLKNLFAISFGIFILILIELSLRLFPTKSNICQQDPFISFKEKVRFLVEEKSAGESWLTINPRLKIYFNPVSFPLKKSASTRRIFILGGSSALGFPFGEPGAFSHFLSLALVHLDPEHHYQVINLAGFGYASYRVLRVFEEVLSYQPDLIIVMSGHNEFLEKREYAQSQKPIFLLQKKLSRFHTYCLLENLVFKILPAPKKPLLGYEVEWKHFIATPKLKKIILEHYQYNLARMTELAKTHKIPVLFLTCPSNLKDFPPYHSVHKEGLKKEAEINWGKNFQKSLELISRGEFSSALSFLENALSIDPQYALSWYLLGKCYYSLDKIQEAKKAFIKALELDAWQVRALVEFNQIILSMTNRRAWVLDLIPVFEKASPKGIPGEELFYDHCHPRIETQSLIAREVISKLMEVKWLKSSSDWEEIYSKLAEDYLQNLPEKLYFQAYLNLAIEIGLNMNLPKPGLKYLELAKKIQPEHPKIKAVEEKFLKKSSLKSR